MNNNSPAPKKSGNEQGFTLLEVLMALAIFAICSAAITLSDGQSIRQVLQVKNKMAASILAEETLNQLYTSKAWPDIGVTENTSTLGERQWLIQRTVMPWKGSLLRQVNISIYTGDSPAGKNKVYQLTSFIGKSSHDAHQ